MGKLNFKPRTIFCRDNLDVLRGINSACINLIYLDPPFNKKKVFTAAAGSSAEGAEFSDIFREEDVKDEWVKSIEYESPELYSYLTGVKTFGNRYNYCYLVYMAIRLIECRRVLKSTGGLYLHCDPTMSHYLKIVLDCVFGERDFRNEIIWCYTGPGSAQMRQFNRKHDVLFWYSKGRKWAFNKDSVRIPHKDGGPHTGGYGITADISEEYGRRGKVPETWWNIRIAARSKSEYIGYPTQKPLALLERVIRASSNAGDIVLDPFCGCATTCVAAEKLGRQWAGIDISVKAYELVNKRLKAVYAEQGESSFTHPLLMGKYVKAHFTTAPPKRGKDEARERGYVYVISNDSWPGFYKVGVAKDVTRRLNTFKTSDPHRAYHVKHKLKTPYYREIERHIHAKFNAANEWVQAPDLQTLVAAIKHAHEKKGAPRP